MTIQNAKDTIQELKSDKLSSGNVKMYDIPSNVPVGVVDALDEIHRNVQMGLMTYDEGTKSNSDVMMTLFTKRFKNFGFSDTMLCGSWRMVLIHEDGWVIKVPLDVINHSIENQIEFEILKYLPTNELEWFPKTYMPIPSILLQERCNTDSYLYGLNERSIKTKALDLGLEDIREDNIGWRGGNYVFIDFQPMYQGVRNDFDCFVSTSQDNDRTILGKAFRQLPVSLKNEYNHARGY